MTVLRQRVAERGQAALERQVGVSKGYLSHVLAGLRPVSPKLAGKLGFETVVIYRRPQRMP
jgi:hypothetical protein